MSNQRQTLIGIVITILAVAGIGYAIFGGGGTSDVAPQRPVVPRDFTRQQAAVILKMKEFVEAAGTGDNRRLCYEVFAKRLFPGGPKNCLEMLTKTPTPFSGLSIDVLDVQVAPDGKAARLVGGVRTMVKGKPQSHEAPFLFIREDGEWRMRAPEGV